MEAGPPKLAATTSKQSVHLSRGGFVGIGHVEGPHLRARLGAIVLWFEIETQVTPYIQYLEAWPLNRVGVTKYPCSGNSRDLAVPTRRGKGPHLLGYLSHMGRLVLYQA